MSPQRDSMIIRQVPEQHMGDEDNQWTLESPTRTLKMGSPSASTATNIGIWQKNADRRRKNMKLGNVSNVKRKDILQETARQHSR